MDIATSNIQNLGVPITNYTHEAPRISIFGMGYVGVVSAACLTELGFPVLGVDLNKTSVNLLNQGNSPIVEKDLNELLEKACDFNLLEATTNGEDAVINSDITFISVGTPTDDYGGCDLSAVMAVAETIGKTIQFKNSYHLVVVRSSVPPGTTLQKIAKRIEQVSNKKMGKEWGLCFNPEFLREGTAVDDFFNPPKTVIGANDEKAAAALKKIYNTVDENIIVTDICTAEMVKYVDNTWHATKVSFANEVGRISKALDIDSHKVMNIFTKDLKLNLSSYYLKPGFAYGGSCLPKEVRAMQTIGEECNVDIPLISSLNHSNHAHILSAIKMIEKLGIKKIGFLGVTFKPDTDDLRESPILEVMANVHSLGLDIKFYDNNFSTSSRIMAQTKKLGEDNIRLEQLMKVFPSMASERLDMLADHAELLVVSHNTKLFKHVCKNRGPKVHVLDLVRLFEENPDDETYHGIGW